MCNLVPFLISSVSQLEFVMDWIIAFFLWWDWHNGDDNLEIFFPEESKPLDPNRLDMDALSGNWSQGAVRLSGSLTAAGDLSCLCDVHAPCSVLYPYLHCEFVSTVSPNSEGQKGEVLTDVYRPALAVVFKGSVPWRVDISLWLVYQLFEHSQPLPSLAD